MTSLTSFLAPRLGAATLALGCTLALLAAAPRAAHAVALGATMPTVIVAPGATVDVPIECTSPPAAFGVTSLDFRIAWDPTWVQSAQLLPGGLVTTWGAPFTLQTASSLAIAAAGGTPITAGDTRIATLRLVLAPGVPAGTDIALAFERFWFNEAPSAGLLTDGLVRVRVGGVGVEGDAGAAFALAPAAPSPARSSTRLAFVLPPGDAGPARLTIHDAAGRCVRVLTHGALPPGRHAVTWDLRDAAGRAVRAGAYFARLEQDGKSRRQRLVVVR